LGTPSAPGGAIAAGKLVKSVCKTQRSRRKSPADFFTASQDSVALGEQIRVIDNDRLIRQLGTLSDARMREVDDALRAILAL
jgi:mRNA-degrading endonuclease toxin of MazEF toxin-antitoxin module